VVVVNHREPGSQRDGSDKQIAGLSTTLLVRLVQLRAQCDRNLVGARLKTDDGRQPVLLEGPVARHHLQLCDGDGEEFALGGKGHKGFGY
jgi:hypothetical protein